MNPSFILSKKVPILVVEDEALIRLGLALEFEAAGYEVLQAGTADQALDFLQSERDISAVVTDLRMPGQIDGLDLVAWLRQHRPATPVIIATGYPTDLHKQVKDPTIIAVVSKPYRASDILNLLEDLEGQSSD
jgi:CheY-like chemotaxis protein